jgi:acyl-CoA synthetase
VLTVNSSRPGGRIATAHDHGGPVAWPAVGRSPEEIASYIEAGYWGTSSLADHVRHWSDVKPEAVAFAGDTGRLTWAEYDAASTALAARLVEVGAEEGERVATFLPDAPEAHVAWLAAEKASLVAVGIGSRAGDAEIRHLLERSGAQAMITTAEHADRFRRLPLGAVVVDEAPRDASVGRPGRGPSEVSFLNSTSGTTGLPKLVAHTLNRWLYFHQLAVEAGELSGDDVFFTAIPSPFGFGLWTGHFTPAFLGSTTHLRRRFDSAAVIEAIASERVTVLAAVTTQLIMMLGSPALDSTDLSSLRVVFTGGEAVPYEKAAEFEDRTGCKVLQFYGSNETGAASRTTVRDDREHRLGTAGRVIDEMQVRLFSPEDPSRPVSGRSGQPGCRGPATCEGYWSDDAANAQLYNDEGWMLMGDLVEIDESGYLTVVGRTSDIIIRGGKNVSAAVVEAEVMTHPAVTVAAAVAMPDPVFGERVCVYVELAVGRAVTLEELTGHLQSRGVTREWWPERLVVLDSLPRSSGGKVAKGELRADIRTRLAEASGDRDL